MSSDFPSSVSCVSEICFEDEETNENAPLLFIHSIPTLYSVVQKAAPEFSYRFPQFRPSYPIYLARTPEKEVFSINFVWMDEEVPRSATMVFQATRGVFSPYKWQVTFNPWHSHPQGQSKVILDWIYLYFVKFEPALYTLERLFTDFYNLNATPSLP